MRLLVNQQREALEAWDAQATAGSMEGWRRQQMASDPGGDLRRAQVQALAATRLARTVAEEYRAAALLARLECDLGHHDRELQQAETLVKLEPRDIRYIQALRHAAWCNGLEPLAEQAESRLEVLAEAPNTQ